MYMNDKLCRVPVHDLQHNEQQVTCFQLFVDEQHLYESECTTCTVVTVVQRGLDLVCSTVYSNVVPMAIAIHGAFNRVFKFEDTELFRVLD